MIERKHLSQNLLSPSWILTSASREHVFWICLTRVGKRFILHVCRFIIIIHHSISFLVRYFCSLLRYTTKCSTFISTSSNSYFEFVDTVSPTGIFCQFSDVDQLLWGVVPEVVVVPNPTWPPDARRDYVPAASLTWLKKQTFNFLVFVVEIRPPPSRRPSSAAILKTFKLLPRGQDGDSHFWFVFSFWSESRSFCFSQFGILHTCVKSKTKITRTWFLHRNVYIHFSCLLQNKRGNEFVSVWILFVFHFVQVLSVCQWASTRDTNCSPHSYTEQELN